MLSLTRKTDYGLVALAFLGQRQRDQAGPVSARAIAERFALPASLLMNILKELNHAQLVDSVRGKHGGYQLAGDPTQITLAEVFTALEGPLRFAACAQQLPILAGPGDDDMAACGCPIEGECLIRTPILRLHHRLQAFFEQTTLDDLIPPHATTNASMPIMPSLSCGCPGKDTPQTTTHDPGAVATKELA